MWLLFQELYMSQINSKIKTLISSYLNRFATVIFCGTTCLCLICKLYISHLMYAIANTKNLQYHIFRDVLSLLSILYLLTHFPVSFTLYPVSCILYPVSYILWYINYLISLIDLWYFHFTMCVYYIYIHTPH